MATLPMLPTLSSAPAAVSPVYLNASEVCDLCALELPVHNVLPWSDDLRSLVDHGTPKRHRRSLLLMARELVNCSSVDRCSQLWSFMTFHVKSHPKSSQVWKSLWHHVGGRMMDLRRAELMQKTDFSGRLSEASEESSVLLLASHAPGYFKRRDVAPFVRQLECYAAKRQMRFTAMAGPWPVKHENVAIVELMWNLHQFWATQQLASDARDQDLRVLLDDLIAYRRLRRSAELLAWPALNVYHDDPKLMVKIWAIEQELANESIDMVIYLDADTTLRPDAQEWGLVPFLTGGNESGHIFVRDSFPGTECVNTGFLGFRNSAASKRLLELWKQKTTWSMFWDQNSFAESILELVGMEMEELGRPGYNSQCVRYMFPVPSGMVPDTMYCDCWQAKLAEMIGPYRQRSSRLVSFVDPEHVDVNFVPNDIFYNHNFKLKDMFLDSRRAKIMNPLIIHWAGLRRNRLRVARKYLKERFNASFSEGICSDSLPMPMPPSFASNARYIKCCKSLVHGFRTQGFVEPQDFCYWSCCDWEPLQLDDCWKYK